MRIPPRPTPPSARSTLSPVQPAGLDRVASEHAVASSAFPQSRALRQLAFGAATPGSVRPRDAVVYAPGQTVVTREGAARAASAAIDIENTGAPVSRHVSVGCLMGDLIPFRPRPASADGEADPVDEMIVVVRTLVDQYGVRTSLSLVTFAVLEFDLRTQDPSVKDAVVAAMSAIDALDPEGGL